MNHLSRVVLRLEVGDVERANGVERSDERRIGLAAVFGTPCFAHLAQRSQHARPIKPLPLTMFAKAHHMVVNTRRRERSTIAVQHLAPGLLSSRHA
jgi:hypothetical protein